MKIKETDILHLEDECLKDILDKWTAFMRKPFYDGAKRGEQCLGVIYGAMHGVASHYQNAVINSVTGNMFQIEKNCRDMITRGNEKTVILLYNDMCKSDLDAFPELTFAQKKIEE